MNYLAKTFATLVAVSGVFMGTANAETSMAFETPSDGDTISGRVQISGWAVDPVGIEEVKLYIDGVEIGEMPYGSSRVDVGTAFPDIEGSENSGFGATFNSRKLENGPHVFTVEVENFASEETSISNTVVVSNEPGPSFPPPTIDLSEATARVVNGVVFLDNVRIGDQVFNNLDLVFNEKTRQFSFGAFSDDFDGDGYRDDDSDKDGFSDDDYDKDGFRDDDDGTVQPGVPLAFAEVKGEVISVDGNTIVIASTDPEHGGAVGNVTVDITEAVLDDSMGGQVVVGDFVEAKGAWDGSVLTAVFIESDEPDAEKGGEEEEDLAVLPGVPLANAEVKGVVKSVNGNTIVVTSTDPEHGGAVGDVTIDITNAVLDNSLGGSIDIGEAIEAKGDWDGSVLHADFVELDD
ncbi:MAG: Ig-like domain-containing protein [bacterium]